MKKLFAILLTLVLAASFCFTVSAATPCYVEELGMSVTIPSGYSVFTRDTDPSDPVFDTVGLSGDYVLEYMESNDIYLDALASSGESEIVVTMTENIIKDFSSYSESMLDEAAAEINTLYAGMGVTLMDYTLLENSGVKYIVMHIYNSANDSFALQYYTINDYKAVNLTYWSYVGEVDSSGELAMETLINSVVFDDVPATPATEEEEEPEDTAEEEEAETEETVGAAEDDKETKDKGKDKDEEKDGLDPVLKWVLIIAPIAVVIIAAVIVIIVVASKSKKKKALAAAAQADFNTQPVYETQPVYVTEPVNVQTPAEPAPAVLPEEPVVSPSAEEPKMEETPAFVFCHNCGNRLAAGTRFCNKCGTQQKER